MNRGEPRVNCPLRLVFRKNMEKLFFVLIVATLLILPASQACIRFTGKLQSQGEWDDKETPRNSVKSCECGKGHSNLVFISWKSNNNGSTSFPTSKSKPCLGIVVTSNLVATSHNCMRLSGTQIMPYDGWWSSRPQSTAYPFVFPPISDIIVSSTLNSSQGEKFTVERLIINPNFALYAHVDKLYSGNDLLLLLLKADFTEHKNLTPICIPASDTEVDLTGQAGILVGVNKPGLYSDTNIYEVGTTGIRFGSDCGDRKESWVSTLDRRMDRQLCARYQAGEACVAPTEEGSPLISGTDPPFLLGILNSASPDESGGGLLHLTNIFPLVKYLEHHANWSRSKWCATPKFSVGEKVDSKIPSEESLCGPWPWTKKFNPPPRDMSLNCECGLLNSGGQPHSQNASIMIVGGKTASPREFGWMVKLLIWMKEENGDVGLSSCGGSVINDRMILSAAHCFTLPNAASRKKNFVPPPESTEVYLSAHELDDDPKEVEVFLKAIYVHHGFIGGQKSGQFAHDIAILVLKKPLSFIPARGNGLRPVCLPKFEDIPNWIGKTATVAGWGDTSHGDDAELADELQKLDVPITEMSVCEGVSTSEKILDGFLCAGTLDPNKDSASGDSGGPLMVKNGTKHALAGIVSYGFKNKTNNKTAALYTDVHKAIRFVDYYAKQVEAKWCKS